jgi:hypothetical protein
MTPGKEERQMTRTRTGRARSARGYDANVSAQWSVYKTSTGQALVSNQPNLSTANDGVLDIPHHGNDPCGVLNSCDLTVTNSLGSSVTIILPPGKY